MMPEDEREAWQAQKAQAAAAKKKKREPPPMEIVRATSKGGHTLPSYSEVEENIRSAFGGAGGRRALNALRQITVDCPDQKAGYVYTGDLTGAERLTYLAGARSVYFHILAALEKNQ